MVNLIMTLVVSFLGAFLGAWSQHFYKEKERIFNDRTDYYRKISNKMVLVVNYEGVISSPLQMVPNDEEEARKYFSDMNSEFVDLFNDFNQIVNESKPLISSNLSQKLIELLKLLKEQNTFFVEEHFEPEMKSYVLKMANTRLDNSRKCQKLSDEIQEIIKEESFLSKKIKKDLKTLKLMIINRFSSNKK